MNLAPYQFKNKTLPLKLAKPLEFPKQHVGLSRPLYNMGYDSAIERDYQYVIYFEFKHNRNETKVIL
jgi:hypothetical protein